MAKTEEDFAVAVVPPWAKRGAYGSFLRAIGAQGDLALSEYQEANKCRMPLLAPSGALPYIGSERQLERYATETDDDYSYRLWDARSAWQLAGTDIGVLNQFKLATGLTNVSIRNNRDWNPAPPDGNTDWWSRFWVVIGLPHPWVQHRWGEGSWGDGRLWGGSLTTPELELMKRVIKKWKASHAFCEALLVQFEDGSELAFPIRS